MKFSLLLTLFTLACEARRQPLHVKEPTEPKKINFRSPVTASQNNINYAMDFFDIQRDRHCPYPIFDPNLTDRGVTEYQSERAVRIFIGPSAFRSFALLGSTLSHEVEVHCNQSYQSDNVNHSEAEAYLHEINQRKRFHLSDSEVNHLKQIFLQQLQIEQ